MIDISLWRAFIAAVAGFILGGIWYMPALFGDAWIKLHKFSKKELKEGQSWQTMGLGFVGTFVTAIALSIVLAAWGISTASEAMVVALILSIGFVATANLTFVLWGRESEGAFLINSMYLTLQMVLMAMIIAW